MLLQPKGKPMNRFRMIMLGLFFLCIIVVTDACACCESTQLKLADECFKVIEAGNFEDIDEQNKCVLFENYDNESFDFFFAEIMLVLELHKKLEGLNMQKLLKLPDLIDLQDNDDQIRKLTDESFDFFFSEIMLVLEGDELAGLTIQKLSKLRDLIYLQKKKDNDDQIRELIGEYRIEGDTIKKIILDVIGNFLKNEISKKTTDGNHKYFEVEGNYAEHIEDKDKPKSLRKLISKTKWFKDIMGKAKKERYYWIKIVGVSFIPYLLCLIWYALNQWLNTDGTTISSTYITITLILLVVIFEMFFIFSCVNAHRLHYIFEDIETYERMS